MDIADDIINKIIGDVNTHNLKKAKKIDTLPNTNETGIPTIKSAKTTTNINKAIILISMF